MERLEQLTDRQVCGSALLPSVRVRFDLETNAARSTAVPV